MILNSYSGNTEETVDALNEAQGRNLEVLVVSTGGKIIEWAQIAQVPYIQMPSVSLQPRAAVGYNIRALARGILTRRRRDRRGSHGGGGERRDEVVLVCLGAVHYRPVRRPLVGGTVPAVQRVDRHHRLGDHRERRHQPRLCPQNPKGDDRRLCRGRPAV